MPAFKLSWRGSPRRRPSIKLVPDANVKAHTTATSRAPSSPPQSFHPSARAAHGVLKKPLGPPISRLRRAQQALIGRRRRVSNRNSRVRVSFQRSSTSSGLLFSGTRNSTNEPNRTSKIDASAQPVPWAPLGTPRRRDAGPLPPSRLRHAPIPEQTPERAAPRHTTKAAKPFELREDSRYSLMQVPEEPGYYGACFHYMRFFKDPDIDFLLSADPEARA